MSALEALQICIVLLLGLPLGLALLLALAWLVGAAPGERLLVRITRTLDLTLLGLSLAVVALSWMLEADFPVHISLGDWYRVEDLAFPVDLYLDDIGLTMVVLTTALVFVARTFSASYLHRDPGFFRFFLLLQLYVFGCLLIFLAGSLNLLLAGWEMVGITSVLLIGFFQHRPEPPRNALRVFATYRLADIGLLFAVALSIHLLGSSHWEVLLDEAAYGRHSAWLPTTLALLMVLSASGKSSQGATASWLPRAMEGPTPSTAIFYGAISVHAGAFLIIRAEPLIARSSTAQVILFLIGASTAFLAILSHRTSSDAKTSLAYASMGQVAIIFVEVALGWVTLATVHLVGHATLRTAQFLRAPSLLHDHHEVHAATSGTTVPDGVTRLWMLVVPPQLREWLYAVGLQRGYQDIVLEQVLLRPAARLSHALWQASLWFVPTLPGHRTPGSAAEPTERGAP